MQFCVKKSQVVVLCACVHIRTKENFGGKKTLAIHTVELAKQFGEWTLLQIWQKKKVWRIDRVG